MEATHVAKSSRASVRAAIFAPRGSPESPMIPGVAQGGAHEPGPTEDAGRPPRADAADAAQRRVRGLILGPATRSFGNFRRQDPGTACRVAEQSFRVSVTQNLGLSSASCWCPSWIPATGTRLTR